LGAGSIAGWGHNHDFAIWVALQAQIIIGLAEFKKSSSLNSVTGPRNTSGWEGLYTMAV